MDREQPKQRTREQQISDLAVLISDSIRRGDGNMLMSAIKLYKGDPEGLDILVEALLKTKEN